jgi:hypothetical protein
VCRRHPNATSAHRGPKGLLLRLYHRLRRQVAPVRGLRHESCARRVMHPDALSLPLCPLSCARLPPPDLRSNGASGRGGRPRRSQPLSVISARGSPMARWSSQAPPSPGMRPSFTKLSANTAAFDAIRKPHIATRSQPRPDRRAVHGRDNGHVAGPVLINQQGIRQRSHRTIVAAARARPPWPGGPARQDRTRSRTVGLIPRNCSTAPPG